jgi:hypothetical protein
MMAYHKLYNNLFSYTLVYVEIDEEANLVRRTFDNKLPSVSGEINQYNYTEQEVTAAFENEIKWLTKLEGSKFIPELISYDLESQIVIQKYCEPSCLITQKMPKVEEVVELYYFFKSHNLNKINGSLSNMSFNKSQLIAFDFKHATERPKSNEKEIFNYNRWLVKIDPSLPEILTNILYE